MRNDGGVVISTGKRRAERARVRTCELVQQLCLARGVDERCAGLLLVRTHAADEAIKLTPPREVTLETAIEFIADDELVEITPKSIRIRKRYLKEHDRKKASREAA